MINNFILQTISLIQKSDFRLQFPEVLDTELEDGNHKKITMEFVDYIGANIDIKNNFLLISSIAFLLIDTYLDTVYEELEGKSFKQRYETIEENSDINIIFKEVYRILKLIRNATIHSKSAISIVDENYNIEYLFRNIKFKLTISKKSFESLISLVIFTIDHKNKNMINEYITALLRSYFKTISENITIRDEFSNNLLEIRSSTYLKIMRRYRVLNSKYQRENNILDIEPMEEKDFSGVDYVVIIDNNKYLIPNEVLIDNKIAVSDLKNWEYFDLKSIRGN
jgi:hypothetical protein